MGKFLPGRLIPIRYFLFRGHPAAFLEKYGAAENIGLKEVSLTARNLPRTCGARYDLYMICAAIT